MDSHISHDPNTSHVNTSNTQHLMDQAIETPTKAPTQSPTFSHDQIVNGSAFAGDDHAHRDDAELADGVTNTISAPGVNSTIDHGITMQHNTKYNNTNNVSIAATAAPSKAPTLAPVHGIKYCTNGDQTEMVGFMGACAGADYCKMCECQLKHTSTQELGDGRTDADDDWYAELVVLDLNGNKDAVCGSTHKYTNLCKNVQCEYHDVTQANGVQGVIKITHNHTVDFTGDQDSTEGKSHHCIYNKNAESCSCMCSDPTAAADGASEQNQLHWTYNHWYCATQNGAALSTTHMNYVAGTNPNSATEPNCTNYNLENLNSSSLIN